MKLTGIHFLLTNACTYECDHCFVHSSPFAPGTMPILGGGVRFRGRAADKLADPDLPRRSGRESDECPDEDWVDIGRLHVDAYGNLHPCQGVVVGNIRRDPLRAIVESYDPENHPIIGPLLRGGPAELARAHGMDGDDGYLDACHLCYTVRQTLRTRFPGDLAPPQVHGAEA